MATDPREVAKQAEEKVDGALEKAAAFLTRLASSPFTAGILLAVIVVLVVGYCAIRR